jgi:hypothetical protein
MKKALKKLGIEETHHSTVKVIYDNPMTNIILNGEKLKPFLLVSNQTRMYTLPILIQCSARILVKAIKQEKEIKGVYK